MKSWIRLLVCLLLSTCIWLIHNLSMTYVGVVERHIIACSDIIGRSASSIDAPVISARCKGTGFRLVGDKLWNAPVKVNFASSDFVHLNGDVYSIPAKVLYEKSSVLFGDALNLEAIISEGVSFRFAEESYKTLPVKLVKDISYADQYTDINGVTLSPDSVLVYGEPSLLNNVNAVYTKTLRLSGLSKNKSGTIKLEPQNLLRYNVGSVNYNIEVGRFVEVQKKFKVASKNVPVGVLFSVVPNEVLVSFKCRFPGVSESLENSEFYVDYNDFSNSIKGQCLIKSASVPSGVISTSINPEVCICLETNLDQQ